MNYSKPIKIKTKLAMTCLVWLGFGVAAQAYDNSFNNYDRDHDKRWNQQEYYNAHKEWHRNHDRQYLSQSDASRRFNTYDTNHDGYLDKNEVRRINNW